MKKINIIHGYVHIPFCRGLWVLCLFLMLCSCGYKLKPFDEVETDTLEVRIHRFDRMESLYLTTGDFAALQQMSTDYPNETRTLIESILKLGNVDDPEINKKLLAFYQDSTLQTIISDAELQYANVEDLNRQLTDAFHKLKVWLPTVRVPLVYTQICSLDQSIVVGDESVGICLDKYLGKDYPLYAKYYDAEQRKSMQRSFIVPDVVGLYLLDQFPPPGSYERNQKEVDIHVGKLQWIVNRVMGFKFFKTVFVEKVARYMAKHPDVSMEKLLTECDIPD